MRRIIFVLVLLIASPVAAQDECSLVAIRLGFCMDGVKAPLTFPVPIEFPSLVLPFFGMSSIPAAQAAPPPPPLQPYYPHRVR